MKGESWIWKLLLLLGILAVIGGCASTGSPSGGPPDRTPPALVEEKSDKNFSTNFVPEKIELVFDEWIELRNPNREILISPPFFKNPKISSRGKKVTVEFPEDEPLREDATYTINFGKSIVDFTEGNPADGFRFVFATGDKIDSLTFKGQLEDARSGQPVKDILVLLYDLVEDSVVLAEKPFYYARTGESGEFAFENLKNDTFKLLVLEDLNFNYLLDADVERLAFPDSLFILNDSTDYNPTLRLFKSETRTRILDSSSEIPGVVKTVFDRNAEDVAFSYLYPEDFDPIVETDKDSLLLWFSEPQDSVGLVFGLDTLDFTLRPFDSLFYTNTLKLRAYNAKKTILAPFDSLVLSFSAPLAEIDTALIKLTTKPKPVDNSRAAESVDSLALGSLDSLALDTLNAVQDTLIMDSLVVPVDTLLGSADSLQFSDDSLSIPLDTLVRDRVESMDSLKTDSVPSDQDTVLGDSTLFGLDSLTVDSMLVDSLALDSLMQLQDTAFLRFDFTDTMMIRDLKITTDWKEKYEYQLELLPGAVTDIYGRTNDSLIIDFKTAGLDEFGSIIINLSRLDTAQQYVVLLKLNDEIIRKNIVMDIDSTDNQIHHRRLRVNTYTIELIKDDNRDGKWTTGDYWLKRQPEYIKTFELEKLRENWDLEAEVYWNEVQRDSTDIGLDSLGMSSDSLRLVRDSLGVGRDSLPVGVDSLKTVQDSVIQQQKNPYPKDGGGEKKNEPREIPKNQPDPKGRIE